MDIKNYNKQTDIKDCLWIASLVEGEIHVYCNPSNKYQDLRGGLVWCLTEIEKLLEKDTSISTFNAYKVESIRFIKKYFTKPLFIEVQLTVNGIKDYVWYEYSEFLDAKGILEEARNKIIDWLT